MARNRFFRVVRGNTSHNPVLVIASMFLVALFLMGYRNTESGTNGNLPQPIATGYVYGLPDNVFLLMYKNVDGKFDVVKKLVLGDKVLILRKNLQLKEDAYSRLFHEIRVDNIEGFVDKSFIRLEGEETIKPQISATAQTNVQTVQATQVSSITPTSTPKPTSTPVPTFLAYGRITGIPDGLVLQAFRELDGNWDIIFQVSNGTRVGILRAFVKTEFDESRFHYISFGGKTGYVSSEFIQIE